jgi:DNA-binding protein HU-beta
MARAELVKTLKEKTGLAALAQAATAYEGLFAILADTLKKGGAISICGFGCFKVVERKVREGRNPRAGEEIRRRARP